MDIQADTKLSELLAAYPELEHKIIDMAPPFRNLRNPVLRKTVARLATLEKIARIGNIEVGKFVNMLRLETGQPEIAQDVQVDPQWQEGEPDWITGEPQQVIDGTEMLSRGEHPLNRINHLMHETEPGAFILLTTNFKPIPLIEEMSRQNYEVFSKSRENAPEQYMTFIRRSIT